MCAYVYAKRKGVRADQSSGGEGGNPILARLNIGREGLFSKLGGGGEGGRV